MCYVDSKASINFEKFMALTWIVEKKKKYIIENHRIILIQKRISQVTTTIIIIIIKGTKFEFKPITT